MIHFEEITTKNVCEVGMLSVHDYQKAFVADNLLSLAEAYAARNGSRISIKRLRNTPANVK